MKTCLPLRALVAFVAVCGLFTPARATVPWTMEQIAAENAQRHADNGPHFEVPARRSSALDDPAYFAHFVMLCDFLVSMQYMNAGQNHGGMIEGESGGDQFIIETDNTQEAIREWSQYAIWTDDTARYHSNIELAKGYCAMFPAWHEGDGGIDYYSAHNCGWGFEAVRKFREAYNDTTWNWYADSCATWMNAHSLAWGNNLVNAYAEALGLGGMYFHAVYRGRQDWINHCINRGRALRTWLQASPSRLYSENWALCGGTAVWGLTESLFAAYPDSGALWVEQWGSQVQVWESSGQWNHSFNAWYANAQHRLYELSADSTYWNNAIYIGDSLIGLDGDQDGGIMPGSSYPNTNDHSWVSAYMGWMGMERVINTLPSHDAAVISFASPFAELPHLAGDPLTVAVRIANAGRVPIAGRLVVAGYDYTDSLDLELSTGTDTIVTLPSEWQVADDADLPDLSPLSARFISVEDEITDNDSIFAAFDIRHGVTIFGSIVDVENPANHVPALVEVYHEAYPDSMWTSFLAPEGEDYASGPRPLMSGSNRIVVKPAVQFMDTETELEILWESSPQEVNFTVGRTELALVDDDVNQTYETWFLSSLDSFPSLNARHYDRNYAPLEDLSGISTVIWFCGDDSTETLDSSDQITLQNYLSQGGHLLLTGQNIADDNAAAPFLSTVLRCSLRTSNTGIRRVTGIVGDPIMNGVELFLIGTDGANNAWYPSSIFVLDGGTEILRYSTGNEESCGVSGPYGSGKYVFLSFALEAASGLNGSTTRDQVLSRCFTWFGDSTTSVGIPPQIPATIWLAQNYPNPFNPVTTIHFFAPAGGEPVSLVIYNALGQEVRRLYDGSGMNREVSVVWDGMTSGGDAVATGIYVYRLRTAHGEFSRSLHLLR